MHKGGVREHKKIRQRAKDAMHRVVAEDAALIKSLSRPTSIDRVLSATLLRLLPHSVTPNQLTVFRFVLTPVIIALLLFESYVAGTVLFVVAALSDAADGALARTTSRVTPWGIAFDPLADKLLVGSVAILLVSRHLGMWLAMTIIAVEVILVASLYARYHGVVVPAKAAGKIKMILQCVGLGVLLLYVNFGAPILLSLAAVILYASLFFALMSLFVYRSA